MADRWFERVPGTNRYAYCLPCLGKGAQQCDHSSSGATFDAEVLRSAYAAFVAGGDYPVGAEAFATLVVACWLTKEVSDGEV